MLCARGTAAAPAAMVLPNPFEQEGQWYKAALHVHTTLSDGDVDLQTRLGQYRAAGYQVVADYILFTQLGDADPFNILEHFQRD